MDSDFDSGTSTVPIFDGLPMELSGDNSTVNRNPNAIRYKFFIPVQTDNDYVSS